LSAVFIPFIIGVILKGGSFAPALVLISLLGIAGACCYIFLVGCSMAIELRCVLDPACLIGTHSCTLCSVLTWMYK